MDVSELISARGSALDRALVKDPSQYTYSPLDWGTPPPLSEILYGPDPRFWFELFLKIPTQDGLKPFKLFPWMHEVASRGVTNRELFYKAREIGSSTFWVAEKLRKVLTHPGSCLLIAADKEDNAENLIDYAKAMILSLPDELRPEVTTWNKSEIVFTTPTWKIKALPGGDDAGRSERAMYLICTEMAFWGSNGKYNPEKYWGSVTGALVPEGEIVVESTANTQDDRFHDMWFDRFNGYRKWFFPWQSNPTHDWPWYEQRRRDFARKGEPRYLFVREYPTTPDEGFTGSADMYFDRDVIAGGQADVRDPVEIVQIGKEDGDPGEIQIWSYPVPGADYVIGADVAEGKMDQRNHPDWSNAKVLDYRTMAHVATVHCRLPDDEYAQKLHELGKMYNWAYLGVERNGPGLAVLRTLQSLGYPNIHYETKEATVRGLKTRAREPGWNTTAANKPTMLSELNKVLKARYLRSPDRGFWDEAKSINRATLRAMGAAKDDQVLSMAVAVVVRALYRPEHAVHRRILNGTDGTTKEKGRASFRSLPWQKA